MQVETVIFPVAGLGTRFLPATKAIPKEMLAVVDRPLIQWAVEEAAAAGCKNFIFVSAPEKKAIMAHFSDAPHYQKALQEKGKTDSLPLLRAGLPEAARVEEIYQPAPLGLGHAISCAADTIDDKPFAVILPDEMLLDNPPCLAQMAAVYEGGNMVAVKPIPPAQTGSYGIVATDGKLGKIHNITAMVEKPLPEHAPSNLAMIGRYILQPEIMSVLKTTNAGSGGEIQLTDAIAMMIGDTPSTAYQYEGQRYDSGSYQGFVAANLAFALSEYGANMGDGLRDELRQIIDEV